MLLLGEVGTWYREGGGRHCTETRVEVRDLGMVRERNLRLWLFLAHVGRWECGRNQGTVVAVPVAGWISWKTFALYNIISSVQPLARTNSIKSQCEHVEEPLGM